ncbi:MAG: hypothetical protein JXR07_09540 [Reichenbachiella sp.]
MSNSYHNTTSHYNAYFIAREDIRAIKEIIEDQYEWNYDLVLPVFAPFDSTVANSYQDNIEHCIEKASLAIQWHKGSKWEDNAYILVGEARFYSLDYVNAIETFKYVNTKGRGDDERHEALVNLMRTFIEYEELNNAQAVSDYLKNESLNKKNLKNLYLTRGYLFQKQENLNYMVQNLTQAEPLINNFKERARVNFIIGQVYQSLGFDGEAYKYYKTTLKNNPPYELSFYTKLNMAQVTQLAKTTDIKKIRKYFRKLLKDRKNEEFQDKIYYEMAKFEIRNNNLQLGIDYYNKSIRTSVSNKRQQAHSYWELGKIYYDSLADYKLAKLYYDSTMSVLPTDEVEYEAISSRQEILSNFVEQYSIIQKNDSLLNLVSLSEDSLNAFLDVHIAQEEAAETARRKEERKKQRAENAAAGFNPFFDDESPLSLGANNYEGNVWYFYNSSAVSSGKNAFQTLWGQRTLEDNWRLNSKGPSQISSPADNSETVSNESNTNEESENVEKEFKIDKSELIASLPTTPEAQEKLLEEIEVASYKLGNIYNFDLLEEENAVTTFENLLVRFPETEYKYEVMYLLYLILNELNLPNQAKVYKNKILTEAPESIYGKLIINPNYREDSRIEGERLQKVYAKAYSAYQNKQYNDALALANKGLADYPDNDFVDNMQLLRIIISAKSGALYKYEYELNNFITTYSESELLPYVESLVSASENYQINLVNSTKAKFSSNLDQIHFFVFLYETDPQLSKELPEYFKKLQGDDSGLEIGNMVLDKTNSLILITEFKNKSDAVAFNAKIEAENPSEKINKSGKFYNFVITKENFDIFYQTKELDTYLKFYRKIY